MEPKFSQRVKEIITLAREEALRLGHDYIGTEHLLLGMVREGEGAGLLLLQKVGVALPELRTTIEQATRASSFWAFPARDFSSSYPAPGRVESRLVLRRGVATRRARP